ncbi:MAG TPA: polysaccharide biosynthesis protein, partial [Symbiobacteriaceae bacterium]|nr:polysaccharide biosynthesis protein [Symbiobacteriaceae bacterium]
MKKIWRTLILLGLDLLLSVAVGLMAFAIRFALDGRGIPADYLSAYLHSLPWVIPVRILVYYLCGLYNQVWAHASIPELIRIVVAGTIDSVLSTVVVYAISPSGYPRSVILISWIFKIVVMGTLRLALRYRRDLILARRGATPEAQRTLIFGAGDAGAMLARELARHPEVHCNVVGFIDDDPRKQGYRVVGKPVLGTRNDLKKVVAQYEIKNLIIAMPSAKGSVIREVVEAGRGLGLQLKTLPGIFELVNGTVAVSQIRDVQIEDVLGRAEVQVDLNAIAAYLSDEVVLVTGAGGSIGSELCRQVARFKPKQLLLLGHGENSIYEIDLELRGKYPELDLRPIIADIQDEARIRRVFEQYRPGVVFHAAAHKHVPLMEYNPEEAIKNNVIGTTNVARAADFYRAKRFVLISSDKAV